MRTNWSEPMIRRPDMISEYFGLRLSDHLNYLPLADPGGNEHPVDAATSRFVSACNPPLVLLPTNHP